MSYKSLNLQVNDEALQNRVNSCLHQEATNNPALSGTQTAEAIRNGMFSGMIAMMWDVSLATEAEYAYALNVPVENPGDDETVITDAMILSAVQANWPPDPA